MAYDATEFIQVTPVPKLNLPELEEVDCVTPIDNQRKEYHFLCRPKEAYRNGCIHCGSFDYYSHGKSTNRLVHDVSMGLTKVFIELETPRYRCNDCKSTFNHIFEEIVPNAKFTKRLLQQIKERSLNEPFASIAAEYELSIPKVKEIMIEWGRELEDNKGPIIAPRILGIDEKHITHKMRGVFVDIENGILLEMTPDNRSETVINTITSMQDYNKNIQIVTMDMSKPYKSAVEFCLPGAKIVVDKFHVLADHKRKVQESKTLVTKRLWEEVNALPAGTEKNAKSALLTRMGKNNYLFKFGTHKLASKTTRVSLMAELCEEFNEINILRLLKEGLERMYEAADRAEAENRYHEWEEVLKTADKDLYKPFIDMHGTMRRWGKEIFCYFDKGCRFTNAATEGMNSLIQALNSQGHGYGFEALRYKSLFYESAKLTPKRFTKQTRVFSGKKLQTFVTTYRTENYYEWVTEIIEINPAGSKIPVLLEAIESNNFI